MTSNQKNILNLLLNQQVEEEESPPGAELSCSYCEGWKKDPFIGFPCLECLPEDLKE
jgi:hypothetical protein